MRLFLSLSLLFSVAYAQKPMNRNELGRDYMVFHIEDNGNQMLSKYKGVSIASQVDKNDLYLYGEPDDQTIIYLERIPFSGKFYPKSFKSASFSNGKVTLCSQVNGKATVICNVFNWANETMKFEKEESYDLSKIQTESANALLNGGKITEALATFDSVQFSWSYYDSIETGIKILTGGFKESEGLASRRKFKDAAGLIEKILKFKGLSFIVNAKSESELSGKFGKSLHGMSYSDLNQIITSYCHYYIDARDFDKSIEAINKYRKLFSQNADLLLFLGDAYYGKRDKTKASDAYKQYSDMMKAKKKEKDIPYYVPQRIID